MAWFPAGLHKPRNRAQHDILEQRFADVGVHAGIQAFLHVLGVGVGAHGDDGHSPGTGLPAGAGAAAGGGFTLHSDRGWHYRTPDWVRACGEAGVERSMSRKGHSPDNAACEGFFGRLKVEFFHGRDWRGVSAERFAAELAEWIRWYREGRLKAFDEGGRKVYDTIAGRRRRLGLAA